MARKKGPRPIATPTLPRARGRIPNLHLPGFTTTRAAASSWSNLSDSFMVISKRLKTRKGGTRGGGRHRSVVVSASVGGEHPGKATSKATRTAFRFGAGHNTTTKNLMQPVHSSLLTASRSSSGFREFQCRFERQRLPVGSRVVGPDMRMRRPPNAKTLSGGKRGMPFVGGP